MLAKGTKVRCLRSFGGRVSNMITEGNVYTVERCRKGANKFMLTLDGLDGEYCYPDFCGHRQFIILGFKHYSKLC